MIAIKLFYHVIENTANHNTGNLWYFRRLTSNHPIMRRAYVTMIVLATVFSMAWYKIVIALVTCNAPYFVLNI